MITTGRGAARAAAAKALGADAAANALGADVAIDTAPRTSPKSASARVASTPCSTWSAAIISAGSWTS